MEMLVISLLLLSLDYSFVGGQTCATFDTFHQGVTYNEQIAGSPILEIYSTGLVTCFSFCLNFNLCAGVNFNKTASLCQLMADVETTSINAAFLYSRKENWTLVNLNGACFTHDCPDNSECVVNTTGEITCEVVGCIRPTWLPNVDLDKFSSKPLWMFGEEVTSPCLYGQSETARCETNGSWVMADCSPVPPGSCSEAISENVTSSMLAEIDVDGNGPLNKFSVYCFTNLTFVFTVIGHDLTIQRDIDDNTLIDLDYNISVSQIVPVIQNSSSCQQHVVYDCFKAKVRNSVFWLNRNGETRKYLDGSGSWNEHVCGCHFKGTCEVGEVCNCDKNDGVWRRDEGVITNTTDLPILQFRAEDTTEIDEMAKIRIGPLICAV